MAKVGDIIRFLNSTGGGRILRIEGAVAYVDDDGFEVPALLKECVVVTTAESKALMDSASKASTTPANLPKVVSPAAPVIEDDFEETPEGEKLNVEIAFAAADLKKLSGTTYDSFIVNDSNYCLYAVFMSKGNEDHGWITRFAGIVDPGMQIFMCEIKSVDLTKMDKIAVQYLPFKLGKEFDMKEAASIELKLDTTKFFKFHCFVSDPYFDEPVIAIPLVRDDVPCRQRSIDVGALEKAMNQKIVYDRRNPKKVERKSAPQDDALVVDLHIAELVDTTAGLSSSDMLNLQIDKFREVMDANLRQHGKKIVFIHGKGEGVLRQALLKELNYRYKGCQAQDASFREYGFGATQVKIK